MKPNMGTVDRAVRLLIAIAIAALYFTGAIGGTAAFVLGIFAVVFALTSVVGFCPAYLPLGFSTCKQAPTTHPS